MLSDSEGEAQEADPVEETTRDPSAAQPPRVKERSPPRTPPTIPQAVSPKSPPPPLPESARNSVPPSPHPSQASQGLRPDMGAVVMLRAAFYTGMEGDDKATLLAQWKKQLENVSRKQPRGQAEVNVICAYEALIEQHSQRLCLRRTPSRWRMARQKRREHSPNKIYHLPRTPL